MAWGPKLARHFNILQVDISFLKGLVFSFFRWFLLTESNEFGSLDPGPSVGVQHSVLHCILCFPIQIAHDFRALQRPIRHRAIYLCWVNPKHFGSLFLAVFFDMILHHVAILNFSLEYFRDII